MVNGEVGGEREKWKTSIFQFSFCILFIIMLILATSPEIFSGAVKYVLIIVSGVLGFLSILGIVPATFKLHW